MKLRKQTPAKALIVAATAGLLFAFYSAVRATPRIDANVPREPVDYQRFFAPEAPSSSPAAPRTDVQPHGRTRAS